MKRHREQDTVTAILAFLRAHHIPVWRMNTGATKIGGRFIRFGSPGMADILGIWPKELTRVTGAKPLLEPFGRFLAIEVKSATGRLTPQQLAFKAQVELAGGFWCMARSVNEVAEQFGFLTPGTRRAS